MLWSNACNTGFTSKLQDYFNIMLYMYYTHLTSLKLWNQEIQVKLTLIQVGLCVLKLSCDVMPSVLFLITFKK